MRTEGRGRPGGGSDEGDIGGGQGEGALRTSEASEYYKTGPLLARSHVTTQITQTRQVAEVMASAQLTLPPIALHTSTTPTHKHCKNKLIPLAQIWCEDVDRADTFFLYLWGYTPLFGTIMVGVVNAVMLLRKVQTRGFKSSNAPSATALVTILGGNIPLATAMGTELTGAEVSYLGRGILEVISESTTGEEQGATRGNGRRGGVNTRLGGGVRDPAY
jgi:hypothetical protein